MTERLNDVRMPLTSAALSVLLIRLFLAFEWLDSGTGRMQNILADSAPYFGGLSKAFLGWAKTNPYPFMVDFLTSTAAPNASFWVTATAILEVLVGISLLLGLLTRLGALWGVVMNVIFYLAAGHTSPSTAGINLIMGGAQLAMIIAPGGRVIGLDALLHKRLARVPLW